jgi:hypothetical protein
MGVRTRGPDIKAGAAKFRADRAAHAEAEAVIDRWNRRLATGRDMLWSPTIRAALLAGTPWLDVFCPGCGTSRAIDLRTIDRHPLASSRARPAVLVVPRIGAHAEAARAVCFATGAQHRERTRMISLSLEVGSGVILQSSRRWFASELSDTPRIAQGGKPPQGVTAIDPVMHQEALMKARIRFSARDSETLKRKL